MIGKGRKKNTARFALLPADGAKSVMVAGDFSQWQPVEMRRQRSGEFVATVPLQPGTYAYRFVVDGQWQTDPDHPGLADGPYGPNSVAEIA